MSPRLNVVVLFVVILLLIGMARSALAQSSYPVVNQAAQKERDTDRRFILETELQAERGELVRAQAAFDANPNQERQTDVHRHVENIKALQRELDGVGRPQQEARTTSRALVKAVRPATAASSRTNTSPRFWDPYQRAPEATDFSTTP